VGPAGLAFWSPLVRRAALQITSYMHLRTGLEPGGRPGPADWHRPLRGVTARCRIQSRRAGWQTLLWKVSAALLDAQRSIANAIGMVLGWWQSPPTSAKVCARIRRPLFAPNPQPGLARAGVRVTTRPACETCLAPHHGKTSVSMCALAWAPFCLYGLVRGIGRSFQMHSPRGGADGQGSLWTASIMT